MLTLMDPLSSKTLFSSKWSLLTLILLGSVNEEHEHSVCIIGKILSATGYWIVAYTFVISSPIYETFL